MRNWIKLFESELVDEILYHGTREEFDAFDLSKARTAQHIYTSPDFDTAAYYGPIVYECRAMGPQADITADEGWKLNARLAEVFADRFYDAIESDETLMDAKHAAAQRILDASSDPDMTLDEAMWYVDEDAEFIRVREQVARQYALHLFTEGKVYEYDMNGRLQDDILGEVFSWGYHSIRFTDSNPDGAWISVVIDDPAHIQIIRRVR